MKKVLALASLVCVFGVGCGGDPREAHITNVLTTLNNTSSQLSLVKKKLTDVLKKEKITAEDLKDVHETVEKIREEGKLLQDLNRRITADIEKKPLSKEEMQTYKNKFAGQIESAMISLDQETRAVIPLVDDLKRKSGDHKNKTLAQELRRKLSDTNAEFQEIARK